MPSIPVCRAIKKRCDVSFVGCFVSLFSTTNFDGFLKTIPAHGCFADESIVEVSGHAFFGFLTPRTGFRGVILGDIDVHGSDLSRNGWIEVQ